MGRPRRSISISQAISAAIRGVNGRQTWEATADTRATVIALDDPRPLPGGTSARVVIRTPSGKSPRSSNHERTARGSDNGSRITTFRRDGTLMARLKSRDSTVTPAPVVGANDTWQAGVIAALTTNPPNRS